MFKFYMRLLELFSGTHSVGKAAKDLDIEVVSLDKDLGAHNDGYTSSNHIQEDIMTWDYKVYDRNHFDIISASPVCMWWSQARMSWIGRKLKAHNGEIFTHELKEKDIDTYGKPMVDKVFEIIEYFNPPCWWIENPKSSSMRHYINRDNVVVSYCMYGFDYKKDTRLWLSPQLQSVFKPKSCAMNNECGKMVMKEYRNKKDSEIKLRHIADIGMFGGGGNRLHRYRIPQPLIKDLLECCISIQNTTSQ